MAGFRRKDSLSEASYDYRPARRNRVVWSVRPQMSHTRKSLDCMMSLLLVLLRLIGTGRLERPHLKIPSDCSLLKVKVPAIQVVLELRGSGKTWF